MSVRRGDIVLLDFPYTSGGFKVRPALVVQSDIYNAKLLNTIVAMVSSNLRYATEPTHLLIELLKQEGPPSGLRQDSTVNCTRLYTIEQTHVLRTLGQLLQQAMKQIDVCLKTAFSL